jgi:integrase
MRGERTSVKLWRRGKQGMFYLNIRVPKDIAEAYARTYGTSKILRSLGTSDRAEALRRRDEQVPAIMDRFTELRSAAKLARRDLGKLSRTDLERLAMGYYREVLTAAKRRPADMDERDERIEEWSDELASCENRDERGRDDVRATVDGLLKSGGWPTERRQFGTTSTGEMVSHDVGRAPSGVKARPILSAEVVIVDRDLPQYAELEELVRRAAIEGSRLALAELKGRPFAPRDRLFNPDAAIPDNEAARGPLLSEALAAWKEGSGVVGGRKPRPQTVVEAEMAVRHFTELNGDMRIGEIGKKLVQGYARDISSIPVKLTVELQRLSLPDLLKRDLSKLRLRSASTVNKSLQMLSAMIEQARRRSDLDEAAKWPNWFKLERVESDATAEDDKLPFTAANLRSIFVDGPVHGRSERLKGGRGEAQYWLPLLALFTGARLSELGQLRVCDVQADDSGIAFISIGTSGGRTVKTRTSIRKVPIHPDLRRLGFLGYVEGRRKAGEEVTLWPLLGSAERRNHTAAFSQWFGNYLRRKPVSITDTRKQPMHAFRHLFKDMGRNAGLPEEVNDALTGHASGKSVGRGYGSGHSVARLYAEISKIKVPVDLSHLYTSRVRKAPPGFRPRVLSKPMPDI